MNHFRRTLEENWLEDMDEFIAQCRHRVETTDANQIKMYLKREYTVTLSRPGT